jgi:hypothetical protein
VVLYSTGEVGSAIHYDGNGGYVLIPASASLNVGQGGGFTLEGWIQPGDLINQRPLFEWQFDGVSSGVHFWTSTGGAGCLYANVVDTANNAHPFYSPAGILTSGYQHMALTYDKSTGQASFYRNGALVVSTNLGIFTPKTTGNLLLGERTYLGGASQYNYVGDLDEASVYGRALSLAEIQSIYNAGSAGKCAPTPPPCDPAPSGLISWWPGEGNANDIAGTNNGVVQNILYTGGEVGSAFYLNGSNAFIAMPASSSLNVGAGGGFTFEAWINPGSVLNQQVLAEWNDGAGNIGAQFHLSDSHYPTLGWPVGGFYVNLLDTNGGDHAFTTAAGLVTSNSYQHVALTYDKTSGIAVVYVNGVVVQTENLGFFDIRNG